MLTRKSLATLFAIVCLMAIPCFLFAQHLEDPIVGHNKENWLTIVFEWVEYIADVVGISILIIGFLKGTYMFLRLEVDRLTGKKDYEEIFALRNILGSYIIISLDFLIVSDIIHSVVSPQFTELLNLGIIVLLRTAIGYFLGKELHELRKELKVEKIEEENISH